MTPDGSIQIQPKTAARRLRAELRIAREKADLTQESVAAALDWSPSKVMRIERGVVSVGDSDVSRLAELYGLTQAHRSRLTEYAQVARQRTWWQGYRAHVPPAFSEYLGHEAEAAELCMFNPHVIPGLCQTVDYADAVIPATAPRTALASDAVNDRIALMKQLRANRQRSIVMEPDGPQVRVILDEAVLYREVGNAVVMNEQLLWLAELTRRPQFDLRVLPFSSPVIGFASPFVVLRFTTGDPDVVYLESALVDADGRWGPATLTIPASAPPSLWMISVWCYSDPPVEDRYYNGYEYVAQFR